MSNLNFSHSQLRPLLLDSCLLGVLLHLSYVTPLYQKGKSPNDCTFACQTLTALDLTLLKSKEPKLSF